jgi:hypothetical protein
MYDVKQKTTLIFTHSAVVNKVELELSAGFNIPTLRFKAYGHVAGGADLEIGADADRWRDSGVAVV